MQLPTNFKTNITNTFGMQGKIWLEKLPNLFDYAKNKWKLKRIIATDNLSFNYIVYSFSQLLNSDVVVKISPGKKEFNNEKLTLLYFQGVGINRLLDYDDNYNILLLEKIGKSITLKSLFPHNENESIEQTAKIIQTLHSSNKPFNQNDYPSVTELAKVLNNFTHPQIPSDLIYLAHNLVNQLLYNRQSYLLHGDLHHENILQTNDGAWKSIDPKGIVGNIAYEVAAYIRNPVPEIIQQSNLQQILNNRIKKFSELLELDQKLLIQYSYLATILAVIWNIEDNGLYWQDWLKISLLLKKML